MCSYLFAFQKQPALCPNMGLCFFSNFKAQSSKVLVWQLAKCHLQNVCNLAFADYSSHVLGDKDMKAANFLCIFWFELKNLNCQEMGKQYHL